MAESQFKDAQIPLGLSEDAGSRLRLAREAAGLSRADIAASTRIPERHLASIEAGDFAALAGRSYALGFSRTYARAVGLDEKEITQAVRQELGAGDPDSDRRGATFEPGDPSRIPSRKMAWLAALGALAVLLAGFVFWRGQDTPAVDLIALDTVEEQAPVAAPAAPVAAPVTQDSVVFTAMADRVWVRFRDAAGNQIMQGEMKLGESYTLPAGADGPLLTTARPDALRITVGGRDVPRLSDRQGTMGDVPVSAAALLARASSPAVPAEAAVAPSPSPAAAAPRRVTAPRRQDTPAAEPAEAPLPEDPQPAAPAEAPKASTVSE